MNKVDLNKKLKQAENAESQKEYFSAFCFYKEALEMSRDLGNSEKIKFCKKKIVETSKKAEGEFKKISVEQKIPKEPIDKFINSFLQEKDIFIVLKKIGIHPYLYPRFDQVRESAKKTMPVTYSIASLSAISKEGHLIRGGEDGSYSWLMKMYAMHQEFIMNLYLREIFAGLIKKSPSEVALNKKNLTKYLRDSKIIPERILNIIEIGIKRYFERDFISAIHILVPQFESLFLSLSEKLGIDIIALNQAKKISTRTKTLSEQHLDSEEFQKVWGTDLCQHIKFVFFDPLGYKLRHKVAHGEICAEECNFENVTLVLYFFLVLVGRVKPKQKKG